MADISIDILLLLINMAVVHNAHKKNFEKEKTVETKSEDTKTEPVIVSDTVTETTERIEVIEEVTTEEVKPDLSASSGQDPLTDFKEKMSEEEKVAPYAPAKKNFMWPILSIFIIVLLLMGGIFIYRNNMKSEKVNVVTISPTPTVMAEPTKAIDLSKYEIQILNGSEVEGEAGRQRTNLEEEGFTISSVGNAAESNYTETIIQAKKEVGKAFLDKLKSVLEKSFVVGETEELPQDDDSDVIIIIGSESN